nr:adhesion protein FadA [uncultured Fusobacterium sp.]
MVKKILLGCVLVLSSVSFAEDNLMQQLANEVGSIEAEYQSLLEKENEKRDEFMQEKAQLEQELQELKSKQMGRDELYAKLKQDSEIRWHRDEYKKILKKFEVYYDKLQKKISDKEQQISELSKLLEVLGQN